jgi:hypothetical protein
MTFCTRSTYLYYKVLARAPSHTVFVVTVTLPATVTVAAGATTNRVLCSTLAAEEARMLVVGARCDGACRGSYAASIVIYGASMMRHGASSWSNGAGIRRYRASSRYYIASRWYDGTWA